MFVCSCFDLGYVLSDISDDGRRPTASTVQRERNTYDQPFLPPVSEQELCERIRQRVSAPVYSVSQKSSPPKTFCGIISPGEPV